MNKFGCMDCPSIMVVMVRCVLCFLCFFGTYLYELVVLVLFRLGVSRSLHLVVCVTAPSVGYFGDECHCRLLCLLSIYALLLFT